MLRQYFQIHQNCRRDCSDAGRSGSGGPRDTRPESALEPSPSPSAGGRLRALTTRGKSCMPGALVFSCSLHCFASVAMTIPQTGGLNNRHLESHRPGGRARGVGGVGLACGLSPPSADGRPPSESSRDSSPVCGHLRVSVCVQRPARSEYNVHILT